MKTKESIRQLFLSLGLKPIALPIGIRGWQISHSHAEVLLQKLGKPSAIEENSYGGPQYSWLPGGPIIFLIPYYWGMVFESEEDAELAIPRLRQMGTTKEVSHWFLTMTGEEARRVLAHTPHKVYPNRKEGTVYELRDGKLGYLDCWIYSKAHWFPTREDYTKYETKHLRIEASL